MNIFFDKVLDKLSSSVWNNYSDNHDENRFGKREGSLVKNAIRQKLHKKYISKYQLNEVFAFLKKFNSFYHTKLERLYNDLADEKSKELLIDIMAYRILGGNFIKLPINSLDYHQTLEKIKSIEDKTDTLNPNFLHFKLSKFDLTRLGKQGTLYFMAAGILIDFFLEQYRYKGKGINIGARVGDVVIDAGACWGDTAIYFATQVGSSGHVYSFEFIPGNIELFKKNISLNPDLEETIKLVEKPVWENSEKTLYYTNNGPSSKVLDEEFEGSFGSVTTISIDDFMRQEDLSRIDFLKMDIEGAEPKALEGAREAIKKFKPDLAIAVYHSLDDFSNIPQWINDLNLGYRMYLGHFTIHAEETVLFATAR